MEIEVHHIKSILGMIDKYLRIPGVPVLSDKGRDDKLAETLGELRRMVNECIESKDYDMLIYRGQVIKLMSKLYDDVGSTLEFQIKQHRNYEDGDMALFASIGE